MILHLDPWSGVSGDMLLAALLDTDRGDGHLEEELHRTVAALGLPGAAVEVTRHVEWGVACTRVKVKADDEAPLRHLADMEQLIASAGVADRVRERATTAVRRLAEVEAAIHECRVEDIHFHEVGAVDTLVDVVGTFALVETLGIDRVTVGTIPVGGGSVEIAHGRMGVPAPATARLLEGYEIVGGPEMRELTTPTGALLVGQLGAASGAVPPMRASKIGYGAGCMKLQHGPNLLRAIVGTSLDLGPGTEAGAGEEEDHVVELQSNLDDVSPELVGHACRLLREVGALDVWTVPAHMKKDRPGVVLHALVSPGREAALTALIFGQTGTLGVRRQLVSRRVAERGTVKVTVAGVEVGVKWGRWHGRLISIAPEYEDAAAAANTTGAALKDVMAMAATAARDLLGERS
ncbi:MAG: TIGR00299 family protein [Actinobacteria bacterium RBG_16_64_13]|nr:MAG: TIGR00299 family protein [Actinobacteria bacterium RBG_16_64_13]